jgi:hypothetical protein
VRVGSSDPVDLMGSKEKNKKNNGIKMEKIKFQAKGNLDN